MSLKKLDDIKDFSQVGFHFTDSEEKINSIEQNGLKPLIGDNSSTYEATPKISFSLGLDGLFQTANRFFNLVQTMEVSFLLNNTHMKYLPDNIRDGDPNHIMTTIEALEFMKNYLGNSSYFVFDAPSSKYEHEVTKENLDKANQHVQNIYDLIPINSKGEILDIDDQTYEFNIRTPKPNEPLKNLSKEIQKIQECLNKRYSQGKKNFTPQQLKEYELLIDVKNRYRIKILETTALDLQRGNLIEDGLYDTISFHEEKLEWRKQKPLNIQSRVEIKDNMALGKGVEPENLSILSVNGAEKSNNFEILSKLYPKANKQNTTAAGDIDMVELVLEYINIPANGINQYLATHPEFGYKIIAAQNHAKSAIEKQRLYDARKNKSQKNQSNQVTQKIPKHDNTDHDER